VIRASILLEEKQNQQVLTFLRNLKEGKVCVHPTDTIPGLTCDPWNESSIESLEQNKKRSEKKAFVGLISSFEKALRFWQPLPKFWIKLLPYVWPRPVTFIWKAGTNVPTCFVSQNGELALRYPRLQPEAYWFHRVMDQVDYPLPSTSINYQKGTPIVSGEELSDFCKMHSIYLPDLLPPPPPAHSLPSSLIRIIDEKNYEWLRKGAISPDEFSLLYNSLKLSHL